jgi:2-polyprenyl-3-methyl-5-hydroxy-6-metoxy-1,4-benzoquinol methylase
MSDLIRRCFSYPCDTLTRDPQNWTASPEPEFPVGPPGNPSQPKTVMGTERQLQDGHAAAYRSRSAYDVGEGEDEYGGIRISALRGLHEFVAARIMREMKPGARALDVAAGTGAMCLRLLDLGYPVTAVEYHAEAFAISNKVRCHVLDLNRDFASELGRSFDFVVALEIIEHLENPRAFLRGLAQCLEPGGKIFLSTPNVDNAVSNALYIRMGHFLWFGDNDVENLGHITPLNERLLRQACRDAGLIVESVESFGNPWEKIRGWASLSMLARFLDQIAGRPPRQRGEVLVAVLSRPR